MLVTGGFNGPSPVARNRKDSPRRAGCLRSTRLPSGRRIIAWRVESGLLISKIPGVTGRIVAFAVAVRFPTVTVTVARPTVVSNGTWTVTASCPWIFEIENIGAGMLLNLTEASPS